MKKSYLVFLFLSYAVHIYPQNFWEQTGGPNGGYVNSITSDFNGNVYAGSANGVYQFINSSDGWSSISNNLTNRNINTLAVNEDGHIYAGISGAGVWYSTNNGELWTEINNGLTNLNVYSLIVLSNQIILAGTEDGLFRSTDNGTSWNFILTNIFRSFTICPNGNVFAGTWDGIFMSTDDGITWEQANNGISPNIFGTISVSSFVCNSNGDVFVGIDIEGDVYRSTNNGNSWIQLNLHQDVLSMAITLSGEIFVGTGPEGVYHSLDNGSTWTPINNGFTHLNIPNVVNCLAIDSNNNTFAGRDRYGISRLINGGESWTEVNAGLITSSGIRTLTLNSSGHIFAGTHGSGFFRSSNYGDTWNEINNGINSRNFQYARSLSVNSSGIIFSGTAVGSYRSTNNGDNWVATLNGQDIRSLNVNSNDHVFAGRHNMGLFRSTNNGTNWTLLNSGLPNGSVNSIVFDKDDYIFVGIWAGGVYKSTDNGDSWISKNNGLTNFELSALIINSNGNIFAGTTGGIYVSTDNGDSWLLKNDGLGNLYIRYLVANSSGYVFAATWGGGIYYSDSDGSLWIEINSGLNNFSIFSLAIHTNGYLYAGTWGDGVFKSTRSTLPLEILTPNGGEVWEFNSLQEINWNNYSSEIDSLRIEFSVDSSLTWVTIDPSISADSGSYQWLVPSINSQFCKIRISNKLDSSKFDISDEFFSIMPFVDVEVDIENPISFELYQNYPNPFNPSTKIKFRNSDFGLVSLKVYDVLGNELVTLVNEEKPAGSYEVEYVASELTSGVYFYTLQVGTTINTKKMVLLK